MSRCGRVKLRELGMWCGTGVGFGQPPLGTERGVKR